MTEIDSAKAPGDDAVERVARAICLAVDSGMDIKGAVDYRWDWYVKHAKAAISAMPEAPPAKAHPETVAEIVEQHITEKGYTGLCSAHRDGENPRCTICYPAQHTAARSVQSNDDGGSMTDRPTLLSVLMPCPFCGNSARTFIHAHYWCGVECNRCEASVQGFDTEQGAGAAWNTRATPSPVNADSIGSPVRYTDGSYSREYEEQPKAVNAELLGALREIRAQVERVNRSGWNAIVMERALEDLDDIAQEAIEQAEQKGGGK